MRVIAGKARRIQLKTIEGMDTRPTTDRIKETLFNMLSYELYDCRFLDLFAGSGGIGIEALSRGGKEAVFVEKNPKAVECIRENLQKTGLMEQAEILKMDVLSALTRMEGRRSFDLIFMDPPYRQDLEKHVLSYLQHSALLAEDGLIIVEASLDTTLTEVETYGFRILKQKKYKTNQHYFLERSKKEEA